MSKENALARQSAICSLATMVKSVCVDGAMQDGRLIGGQAARADSMVAKAKDVVPLLVEGLGEDGAGQVLTAWQSSIEQYANTHNNLPADEILAAGLSQALKSLPNTSAKGSHIMVESVHSNFETSEGSPLKARTLALIMPVLLTANTSDMVTHIPSEHDEVELYKIHRVATTSFGDLKAGDVIEEGSTAQYSNMKQIFAFDDAEQPLEDGTKKSFVFDTALHTPAQVKLPIKRHSVTVYYNSAPVLRLMKGSETNLTAVGDSSFGGTVDLTNGKVTVTHDSLTSGSLSLRFEVDIEKNYNLVPMINAEPTSVTLTPSYSVIGSEYTHQSFWALNRELGVDLGQHLMAMQRNLLAYDKDITNLTMAIHASAAHVIETFDVKVSEGHTFREHYQQLEMKLNKISTEMRNDTKKSGIVGLFVGSDAINVLKGMGAPFFEVAPNYREVNRIHYVGKLFGRYKVFLVPQNIKVANVEFTSWDILAYGRGENHAEAGIVNGDAIAPTFIHEGATEFKIKNVLIALRYQDVHPDGGHNYFRMLRLFKSA